MSTIFEKLGQLQAVPVTTAEDNNTLNPRHAGKLATLTANVGVPAHTFKADDLVAIMNTTGAAKSVVGGAGLTLKLEGSGATGTRTLAAYSQATIWFESTTIAWITGGGVS